jgi:hypothetical protein
VAGVFRNTDVNKAVIAKAALRIIIAKALVGAYALYAYSSPIFTAYVAGAAL